MLKSNRGKSFLSFLSSSCRVVSWTRICKKMQKNCFLYLWKKVYVVSWIFFFEGISISTLILCKVFIFLVLFSLFFFFLLLYSVSIEIIERSDFVPDCNLNSTAQSQINSIQNTVNSLSSQISAFSDSLDELKTYLEYQDEETIDGKFDAVKSYTTIFFYILLKILYQSLCYLSNLSQNYSFTSDSRSSNYSAVSTSKLHVKVDYTVLNLVSFLAGINTSLFTIEIVPVTENDNFIGGRIITDTHSYDVDFPERFLFTFEFEVFAPAIDFDKFFKRANKSDFNKDLLTLLMKSFFKTGLNTSLLSAVTDRLFSRSWTDLFLSKSRPDPCQENWTLLDGASISALPAVIDTAIDVFDTGVDTVDAVFNRVSDWRETIDDAKNTIIDISEQSKLDLLLASQYSPEIFNRNLGNALNFPRNLAVLEQDKQYVVQKIDSPTEYVSLWEFLADIIDDAILDDNLRWNWDFSNFIQFLDDTGVNKLWLSNELKYINAKFPRRSV